MALFAFELLGARMLVGHDAPRDATIEIDPRCLFLVALPAVAMGLQNATLTHFGDLNFFRDVASAC